MREAGVDAVGIDAAAIQGSDSEKLDIIEIIAELAEENELQCYGYGFDSVSMTTCAVCTGVQHISGAVITAPTEKPQGFREIDLEQICDSVLSNGAAPSG